MIGIGKSIFEGSLLGRILGYTTRIVNPDRLIQKVSGKDKMFGNSSFDDRTKNILSGSQVPVGVFINKNSTDPDQIVVPFLSDKDGFLVEYIQRLIKNSGAQVSVSDPNNLIQRNIQIKETLRAIEQEAPNYISLNNSSILDGPFISQFQLIILSAYGWNVLLEQRPEWLNQTPSILILRE